MLKRYDIDLAHICWYTRLKRWRYCDGVVVVAVGGGGGSDGVVVGCMIRFFHFRNAGGTFSMLSFVGGYL